MTARVFHADLWGNRKVKESRLDHANVKTTDWAELAPVSPFYFFVPRDPALSAEYQSFCCVSEIFPVNSVGIVTARDSLAIHCSAEEAWKTAQDFASLPADEARRKYDLGPDARDWKVSLAQDDIRASGLDRQNVSAVLYRPFDVRFTYYTGRSRGFICMPRPKVMRHVLAGQNLSLITSRLTKGETFRHAQATRHIVEVICMSPNTSNNGFVFPLYVYPVFEEKRETKFDAGARQWPPGRGGRRPNLNPEFVAEMEKRLGLKFIPDGLGDLEGTFGPEDVFHYIYAIFHSPTYRKRYAEFLKRDFPRVPLTSNLSLFRELCQKGADLVALHLMEGDYVAASWNRIAPSNASPFQNLITRYPVPGDNLVEKVFYLAPGDPEPATGKPLPCGGGRVYISKDRPAARPHQEAKKGQYFEGVPPEVWEFHVGGYQVCEKWLKDRKGRKLSYDDIQHYHRIVVALNETIRLMSEIDAVIPRWPIE